MKIWTTDQQREQYGAPELKGLPYVSAPWLRSRAKEVGDG